MNYEAHEYANIFPMIGDLEFEELKKDIKDNGLLQPIVLFEDKVLDGRNRYKACLEVGVIPVFEEYKGDKPLEYVISLNLNRRHLTASQRSAVAVVSLPFFEAEARKRQIVLAGTRPNKDLPKKIVEGKEDKKNRDNESAVQVAKLYNTNAEYVREVKRIKEKSPEVFEAIRNGEKTISEVIKEEKKQAKLEVINTIREEIKKENDRKQKTLIDKKYDIITIDPPWTYEGGSEAYDSESFRGTTPYPTMSIEEIKKIPLPAKEDCVLWLWTTHKHMRYAFELLDNWGFEEKAILTWVKNRMGIGRWLRSQSEFCIMAVKGKPLINLTNQTTILTADNREHSRKPEEFYTMVDSLCVGYKLDYFAREQREGWDTYGIEDKKF